MGRWIGARGDGIVTRPVWLYLVLQNNKSTLL